MTGRADASVSVSHARAHLAELVERVRDGEIVYLSRYGRRLAALVPLEVVDAAVRQGD
jgi:prevent-host-death family protein